MKYILTPKMVTVLSHRNSLQYIQADSCEWGTPMVPDLTDIYILFSQERSEGMAGLWTKGHSFIELAFLRSGTNTTW